MAGNPNFQYSHTSRDYTAVAIEKVVAQVWQDQTYNWLPIIAAIEDTQLGFNKGFSISGGQRPYMICPVLYEDVAAVTSSTLGVGRSAEIPNGYPNYDNLTGFTQARYEVAGLGRPLLLTYTDQQLLANGDRGNIVDGKIRALMSKWARVKAEMLNGSTGASDSKMQGLMHVASTANTVGEIPQATNTWWQSNVITGTGALTSTHVSDDYDLLCKYGQSSQAQKNTPDLLLADYAASGFNVYGKLRSFLESNVRYVDPEFKAKFGLSAFEMHGMKVMMNPQGQGGNYYMLNTSAWFVLWNKKPKMSEKRPIHGYAADEFYFHEYTQLGCGAPRLLLVRKEITS